MNNKKIEVELYQYETLIFGKVLHVDESILGREALISTVDEDINRVYSIFSSSNPCVDYDGLYVWGTAESSNGDIISCNFTTKEEATRWAKNISKLIEEFNNDNEEETEDKIKKII